MAKKTKNKKKLSRKAYLERRNRESYEAYLRNRKAWEIKGYALDEALSYDSFTHFKELAQNASKKNIAREFAAQDRKYTLAEAREYRQRAQILLGELPISSTKFIKSNKKFVKEAQEGGIDEKTKEKLRAFLKETENARAFVGTKRDRQETFEMLREMGLGYRGADAVMYG